MSDDPLPNSEIILYQTEDGRTRVQCRFEDVKVWLSQKLMADLFGKDVRSINKHIQNVFAEGELVADSVIWKCRITAADGKSYETHAAGRHRAQGRCGSRQELSHGGRTVGTEIRVEGEAL
jgi:hypothetical protein